MKETFLFSSLSIAVHNDGVLNWLLSDHLGSTSITANADGSFSSEIRYSAFGEVRYSNGTTPTGYQYTNQLNQPDIGLYYYVARFYDPVIAHFVQADTIVPGAGNPAAYDRYSYVLNNPISFIDPTGHYCKKNLGKGTFSDEACPPDATSYHGEVTSGEIAGQAKTAASAKKQSSGGTSTQNNQTGVSISSTSTDIPFTNCINGPTISSYYPDPWWNTNPHNPDYMNISGGWGEVVSVSPSLTIDRFGQVYFGVSVGPGLSLTPVTGSTTGGFIGDPFDDNYPKYFESQETISGWGVSGEGGILGGGRMQPPPYPSNSLSWI